MELSNCKKMERLNLDPPRKLLDNNGYWYTRRRSVKNSFYYKCLNIKCRGRGVLHENVFTTTHTHSCVIYSGIGPSFSEDITFKEKCLNIISKDGYLYCVRFKYKNRTYYKCQNHKCKARAIETDVKFRLTKAHTICQLPNLKSPKTITKHMVDKSTITDLTTSIVCTSIPNPNSELLQGPFVTLTTQKKHLFYINNYLYTFRGLYKSSKYYRCYNRDCKSSGILVDDLFELRKPHDSHENHKRLFTILSNKYAHQNGTPTTSLSAVENGNKFQALPLSNTNIPNAGPENKKPEPEFLISQKGKTLLYFDSYFYHRTNAFKDKTYYKCRTRHCPGRGVMGQSFYLTKAHNHPSEEDKHLSMTFLGEIKAAVAESPEKLLKELYYEVLQAKEMREREILAKIPYQVIAKKLKKTTKVSKTQGNSSSDEISGSSDFGSEDEDCASNFVSEDLVKLFTDNTTQTLFGLY